MRRFKAGLQIGSQSKTFLGIVKHWRGYVDLNRWLVKKVCGGEVMD